MPELIVDPTPPRDDFRDDFEVVLISGAVAMEGHGRRYLQALATMLVEREGLGVTVVIPSGTGLEDELRARGVAAHVSAVDFSALNAGRFRRYGRLAPLMRGLARMRANREFLREAVLGLVIPRSRTRPQICHFLDYEYMTLTPLLRRLEREARVVSAITIHPSDFDRHDISLKGLYKNLVRVRLRPRLQRLGAIFCHGPNISDRLTRQFDLNGGTCSARIASIYYPSDGTDRRIDRCEARALIGCKPEAAVLLSFGIIRQNKRIDTTLQALAHMPEEVVLVIAGQPAELREKEIRGQIEQLGIRDRVILHLRYIAEEEIPAFFSAADAMIATHDATFTSASGIVSDCRTYRLPVVASDVGQIGEYIQTHGVGRTAAPGDAPAFARVVQELLNDPTAMSACRNHIERVASELSWEAFAHTHAAIYRDITAHVE